MSHVPEPTKAHTDCVMHQPARLWPTATPAHRRALTCSHHLAEFGVPVQRQADDVIVVLQIERLPLGQGVVDDASTSSVVEHRAVLRIEQILACVKPSIAKDEVKGEILGRGRV